MIELSAALVKTIVQDLLDTFKWEDLEARVLRPMGVPPGIISESYTATVRVFSLIEWARANGRIEDLLRTALQANHSPRLQMLLESLGLAPASLSLVGSLGTAVADPARWQAGLFEVQRQVCLVRSGKFTGTGFLVGPDQVMTHRSLFAHHSHTLGPVLSEAGGVVVRFDDMKEDVPASAHLYDGADIVMFRLAQEVGRTLVTERTSGTAARTRGWIPCRPMPPIEAGAPVAVVQQVDGREIRVATDVAGFVGVEGNRIRYRTATHPGSAGAPCFDVEWRLIGMHASHPDNVDWNEGVSVDTILRDLANEGWDASPSGGFIRYPRSRQALESKASGAETLDDVLDRIDVNASDYSQLEAWDVSDDVTEDHWAWAEAASVVASYVPEELHPLQPAPEQARVAIQLESQPSGTRYDSRPDSHPGSANRWIISDKLRTASLRRLEQRGELQEARELNVGAPGDPLDALLGAFIEGKPPSAASLRDPAEIRAMQRVVTWLDGVIVPLPRVADLSAQLERATLLAPFRHLTKGFFAGRETELARLTAYVDAPSSDDAAVKPVFIHAAGGMGKSALLSHFILANSERDPSNLAAWRPFVYLDFDRPELDARALASVLVAILRQLGPQVPSIAAKAEEIVHGERTRRYSPTAAKTPRTATRTVNKEGIRFNLEPRRPEPEVEQLKKDVTSLLQRAGDELQVPILLVFDTLEEVQYSNPDAIEPLIDLAVDLRRDAPWVRPVLAGRIEPDATALKDRLESIALQPLPQEARETLLGNQLPPEIAAHTGVVSRMAEIVGGNPLSLRLAAEALRRTTDVDKLLASFDDVMKTVSDAIVQGHLYERILDHVDKRVRNIAIPGVIVRSLTWEVIKDVLAGPCGLGPLEEQAAKDLFDILAAEVALVRQGDNKDVLELRPQLRRVVLETLHKDARSQEKQRLIHEAAVAFYARRFSARSQPEDRAEEIYHRLSLDQDPAEVDRFWVRGIDHLLDTAVDDLPTERARSYLATRVGLVADDEVMRTADAREWEAWAERRAGDLLRFRSAARALEILEMRKDRLPASRLHLVESVVRRTLSPPDLDGAAACAREAMEAARRGGDTSYLNEALDELVLVSRLRGDTTEALRGLAELGNLGDQLGDDLVVLEAATTGLESLSANPEQSTEQFTDTAIRVFGRLSDELIARAPELARRVAAQVGTEDPATLQRVVRLVGTGSLSEQSANELNGLLKTWSETRPDITAFLPPPAAGPREISSAAQYLIVNRPLDPPTASALTNWLQTVVTPDLALPI